jgi:hypothetical protein
MEPESGKDPLAELREIWRQRLAEAQKRYKENQPSITAKIACESSRFSPI